jgi:dienelactone hydrolase
VTRAQTGQVSRLRTSLVALALLVSACTGFDDEPGGDAAPQDSPSPSASTSGPDETGEAGETGEVGETGETGPPATKPPHPVSLPALMAREYDGRGLRLGAELASTGTYRQHTVTYRSGKLRISGVLNVPRGRGPFPALVLAHGYIDPAIYTNGRGMARELDRFGTEGFVTLHVDYRNHAGSDDDPAAERRLRLGYTEDVINAVLALRRWKGPVDDDRVGLVGRSMGGGVVYNALVVKPGLVDAAVVFAPVSSRTADNFNRWIRPDTGRAGLAAEIIERYGEPSRARRFWRNQPAQLLRRHHRAGADPSRDLRRLLPGRVESTDRLGDAGGRRRRDAADLPGRGARLRPAVAALHGPHARVPAAAPGLAADPVGRSAPVGWSHGEGGPACRIGFTHA